jgi:hypothetical protein
MFQKITLAATLCYVAILFTNCQNTTSSDDSAKNNALLAAIVQTQSLNSANTRLTSLTNSLLSIQGYYDTGYYSAGTFQSTSDKLVVSAGLNGVGSWAASTPTSGGTYGKCGAGATASNGTSGGSDSFYRIVQFNNTTNTLILQTSTSCDFNTTFGDNRSTYSKMIVTALSTTGCENNATACFSYCQIVSGKSTLAAAVNDATVADATKITTTGCGGFGWNRALLRSDITTWN